MKTIKAKKTIDLVKKYNDTQLLIKELETTKKQLREKLLELRDSKDCESFAIDIYSLEFKAIDRSIFDKKTYLLENGPNSLDQYMNTSESIKITVKALGKLKAKSVA